jgi:periplasmic divalent cation tolerance protein
MRVAAVVTTVGTEEQANLIARELIARRLAACVNIVPGVRSVYRWQGKIASDTELLLIAKTRESEFELVAAAIKELHSYEVPEILTFDVGRRDPDFLVWIAASTDRTGLEGEEDDEEEELAFVVDADDDE